MKIKIKVEGFECEAETDYEAGVTSSSEVKEATKAATFIRLCSEARTIAFKLIEHKYPMKG